MILAPVSNTLLNGEATVPMSSFPTPMSPLRNPQFFPSSIDLVMMPVKPSAMPFPNETKPPPIVSAALLLSFPLCMLAYLSM